MRELTKEEARAVVVRELERSTIPCSVLDDETIERPWGWVFFYDSSKHLETGRLSDRLAGNAPYIVDRHSGRLHSTGTAKPIDEYILEYERFLEGSLWHLAWSRQLFDAMRRVCVEAMTLVDILPEGHLYYYRRWGLTLWVVAGAHSLIVAPTASHVCENSRAGMRRRVAMWDRARKAGAEPDLFSEAGPAYYAASEDPQTGQLVVAWCHPGDWCGIVRASRLRRAWHELPDGWPDSDRERIERLARERANTGPGRFEV